MVTTTKPYGAGSAIEAPVKPRKKGFSPKPSPIYTDDVYSWLHLGPLSATAPADEPREQLAAPTDEHKADLLFFVRPVWANLRVVDVDPLGHARLLHPGDVRELDGEGRVGRHERRKVQRGLRQSDQPWVLFQLCGECYGTVRISSAMRLEHPSPGV